MKQFSFNRLGIQGKLQVFIFFMFTLVFGLLSLFLFNSQKQRLIAQSDERMQTHVSDLVALLELQHREKAQQVDVILNVASDILENSVLQETDSLIAVNAVHQITQEVTALEVPLWLLDSLPLHNGSNALVDKATQLGGGTATIFQRIPQGYLRISTNVRKENGERAIGTFIPSSSPVAQAIDKGETYRGRAFVVTDWYQTVYRPIRINGEVKGILYAGIHEKDMGFMKELLLSKQYFSSGYAYCFDSKGKFVIHPEPTLVGLDGSEQPFVQEMLQQAQGMVSYLWPPDETAQPKRAYFQFFAPFDLYVAISVHEADIYGIPLAKLRNLVVAIFAGSWVIGFIGVRLIVRHIAAPIQQLTESVRQLAEGKTIDLADSGRHDEVGQMTAAMIRLAQGFANYANFARAIGQTKFQESFQPLSQHDTLGLSLLDMRDKLQKVAEENEQRNWSNDGQAQFAKLLREKYDSLEDLSSALIGKLVKFLGANQGGVFIAEETPEGELVLQMKACYAYGRKKHMQKTFALGEGLAGQVFLEREKIVLDEVPEGFIKIASGLGEAVPSFLVVSPLKIQDNVLGVIEIASLHPLSQHKLDFLDKVAEAVASAVSAVKTNEQTRKLLGDSQEKAQQLAAQEEEMRQNFEELEATQEEMRRRELENNQIIAQLKSQLAALEAKPEAQS